MLRTARLLTAAVLTTATAAAGSAALGTPADAAFGTSVHVRGRLLVVPSEVPGGHPAYGVALADGDIVRVSGRVDPGLRTGAVFDGRLGLPTGVLGALATRGESGAPAALRVVEQRSLTLPLLGTPSITPEVAAQADTPTTHQQFVAALDNVGALGQNDAALLAHVSTVGGYWRTESNGAITGIGVPATVQHYDTALTTSDCGLGDDFFDVVQEAASKFPGIDVFGGSDQLVLFVPPTCQSGGVVGEGTLGNGFASGGALVVKAGASIEGTYAHETGHNYGFDHANARYSGTSLEYYGIYDVMGFALDGVNQLTALSTPFRVFQGVTDPGEVQDVDLGDGTSPVHVVATIRPRSDDTGVRSVKVKNPGTGENLYLDYRSGTGQDAGSAYAALGGLASASGLLWYAPGITINAARATGGNDTLVVDGAGDTSLADGTSWASASRRLTVTVTGMTPTAATVRVDYAPGTLSTARPTIAGRPKVGKTLRARPGTWTTGTAFSYVWYADGSRIRHQTAARLTLTRAQKGTRISVRVTGAKPGYATVSRTSRRTAKVS